MIPDRDQIIRFVQRCRPHFTPGGSIRELSGGNLNLVWRIPGDAGSVIVKHAPPYIASSPDIPMNSNRLLFEARALGSFTPSGPLSGMQQKSVQPPALLGYDAEANLLLMEDISPSAPWFEALSSGSAGITTAADLGRFIGELHRKSYENPEFSESFDNRPVQQTRYNVQYLSLSKSLSEKQDRVSHLAAERCAELGRLLLSPGRCLMMGDLWPPSLLWSDNKLRIIDWEFAHYGRPLQDMAHFCAHCMMHHAVAPSAKAELYYEIWSRVISGYRASTGRLYEQLMNSDEKEWFAVHTGAEILARTIGVFSDSYLFKDLLESEIYKQTVDEGVKLLSGELPGNTHPFIRLIHT